MVYQYLQILVFAIIALLIPVALLAISRLIRKSGRGNAVTGKPYESAEEPVGERVGMMREYLHYLVMFLAFEIIAAIVIVWSVFPKPMQAADGTYVIVFVAAGLALEALLVVLSRRAT